MTPTMRTVVVPVRDLAAARRLYAALLGTEPTTDEPWYVGFAVDGQELGLDPHGHERGMTGPVSYWHVADIAATVRSMAEAGAVEREAAHDVGGGKLVATLADPDGNPIGLVQER